MTDYSSDGTPSATPEVSDADTFPKWNELPPELRVKVIEGVSGDYITQYRLVRSNPSFYAISSMVKPRYIDCTTEDNWFSYVTNWRAGRFCDAAQTTRYLRLSPAADHEKPSKDAAKLIQYTYAWREHYTFLADNLYSNIEYLHISSDEGFAFRRWRKSLDSFLSPRCVTYDMTKMDADKLVLSLMEPFYFDDTSEMSADWEKEHRVQDVSWKFSYQQLRNDSELNRISAAIAPAFRQSVKQRFIFVPSGQSLTKYSKSNIAQFLDKFGRHTSAENISVLLDHCNQGDLADIEESLAKCGEWDSLKTVSFSNDLGSVAAEYPPYFLD